MPETITTGGPITAPFAEPRQVRSRDVLRLLGLAWPFIRPYWRDVVRLFLLLLPGAAVGLLGLVLVRIFFDVIGGGQPLTRYEAWMLRLPLNATRQAVLARTCLAGGAVALAALPYALFVFGYAVWLLQKISNLFRVNLFAQLQELSLSFHSEQRIGDAIFRMFQDSAGIPHVISGLLLRPLQALPVAIANLAWLAIFNYAMAVVAVILIPVEFLMAWAFSASLRSAFLAAREASATATTRIEETVASIKAVKAFATENCEAELYAGENWTALLAERKARVLLIIYRVLSNFLRGIAYLAVLYLGAREVVIGRGGGLAVSAISLGLFQGTLMAFNRITGSSHELAMTWGSLQDVAVGFARVFQILQQQPDDTARAQRLDGGGLTPAFERTLVFDRVTFNYVNGVAVLSGVDFEAKAGELTAILGPSGSGKSTIIALLLRFFDPAEGRILLDGRDLREFDVGTWRQMTAVALQGNPLLTGTIRENVTYSRPEAPSEEICAALDQVGLAHFVESLPAGLETLIGEKGAKLSTGEAQRINVARALLRGAPILLLDEPTSALDLASENQLMAGIRSWLAKQPTQRLAIMMTHRRTAADWADRLYRIAPGRLTQVSHSRDPRLATHARNV
ncbi:MAG: ABC transporter ATP-binding protein [Deltaproteobacteria bacterium]|nr:ABC transporter ATP-binding protein [Deltaproteobacteria bacterium]